ncbi:MAG: hypothetical protein WA624_13300, partial [Methylocella sp.]
RPRSRGRSAAAPRRGVVLTPTAPTCPWTSSTNVLGVPSGVIEKVPRQREHGDQPLPEYLCQARRLYMTAFLSIRKLSGAIGMKPCGA